MSYNKFPWSNLHGFNLDWVIETVKSCKETVDGIVQEVEDIFKVYVTKDELTTQRKLSEKADFTGTWFGETYSNIKQKLNDSLTFATWVYNAINNRDYYDGVFDGGLFTDLPNYDTEIDGGVW